MAFIKIYVGKAHEREISISGELFKIGRANDNHLILHEDGISSHHCQIEKTPEGFKIRDLGSTNGTLINELEITSYFLQDGDICEIGDVKFTFFDTPKSDDFQVIAPPGAASSVSETLPDTEPSQPDLPFVQEPETLPAVAKQPEVPAMIPPPGQGMPPSGGFSAPQPNGPGVLPILSILAAITIIGFPVALLLGVMSLSKIKRWGGTKQDRQLSVGAIVLAMLSMMGILGGLFFFINNTRSLDKANQAKRDIISNEQNVLRALRGIARTQKFAQAVEFSDRDNDGKGEYLSLDELSNVPSSFFDRECEDGEAYGYQFKITDKNETSFLAVAEPLDYGETGVRTFSTDEKGLIHAADLDGKLFAEITYQLPVVSHEEGAYQKADDEIARDILNYVKQLSPRDGGLEKIDRITQYLSANFSLSETARELDGITKTKDNFISEQRAEALWSEAQTAIKEDERKTAINLLTKIQQEHPTYSRHAELEDLIKSLSDAQILADEEKARTLMAEADQLEQDGKQLEAQMLYLKIETEYPNTSSGKRISELKPELSKQLGEKQAEQIFFNMMELNPAKDYDKVLSMVDQLERNFAQSSAYLKNKKAIEKQEVKAQSQKWRQNTIADIKDGKTRSALARLEAASKEHPYLKLGLRDLYIDLYNKVAIRLDEEGDPREALRTYTELKKLVQGTPQSRMIDHKRISKLSHKVGFAEFELKNYEAAKNYLSASASEFRNDPFFNLKLGTAHLYTSSFLPANKYLGQALSVNEELELALLYRAYLNLRSEIYGETKLVDAFETRPAKKLKMEDLKDDTNADEMEEGAAQNKEQEIVSIESYEEFSSLLSEISGSFSTDFSVPDYSYLEDARYPAPKDMNIFINYYHGGSQLLIPATIAMIRQLSDAKTRFEESVMESQDPDKTSDDVKMDNYVQVTKFKAQLSSLRIIMKKDAQSKKDFIGLIKQLSRRLKICSRDLQLAARLNKDHVPVAKLLVSNLEKKRSLMEKSAMAFEKAFASDSTTQAKAFGYAEQAFSELQKEVRSGLNVVTLVRELNRNAADTRQIDEAIFQLEEALKIELDVREILKNAEGNFETNFDAEPEF